MQSESIQCSLLAEIELTFASAVEKAKGMKVAHANTHTLKSPSLTVGKVDSLCQPSSDHSSPSMGSEKPCHRCGKVGRACRYRDAMCHKCKKKGHLAKVCRTVVGKPQKRATQGSTQWVGSESPQPETEKSEVMDLLCCINSGRVSPYRMVVELDGKPVTMQIYTGAAVSLISHTTQTALFPQAVLTHPKVQPAPTQQNPYL